MPFDWQIADAIRKRAMAAGGDLDPSRSPEEFLGQVLDKIVGDEKAQGDEITPDYNSPVDFIAGGLGSKVGSAMARDASSIVGNEIGAIGKNVKKAAAAKAPKELSMTERARMTRAKKMGFDTDKTYYHGTKADFEDFRPGTGGQDEFGKGNYFSDLPTVAEGYAEGEAGKIIPAHLKMENPFNLDAPADPRILKIIKESPEFKKVWAARDIENAKYNVQLHRALRERFADSTDQYTEFLKSHGYDSLVSPRDKIINVFDPSQIRSKFAAFDPKKASSGNISAGLGAVGLGAGALLGSNQAEASEVGKLKLSDLDPKEVQYVGGPGATLGNAPKQSLKLSDLDPSEVEHVDAPVDPKTSPVTAAATGIIQGAVPFAGAIAGAGKAVMNAATGGSHSLDDIVDDYRRGRDEFTKDAKTADDANPKTAFAGNLAGGFSNPLFHSADSLLAGHIPGTGGAALSLPKVIGASAIQGLGTSDADLTKAQENPNNLLKAGIDSGLAAAGGALGYGVGKAIPKVWDGVKYFGKKALTTLGPSEEAINARLAGKAQDAAKNYPEIADDMAKTLENLKSQIFDKSHEARATLSSEPSLPKAYVTNSLDESLKNVGLNGKLIGPTDKEAANILGSLKEDIGALGDHISEQDLKSIIQKMDDNINWGDQSRDKINNILKGLRSKFDQTLKFQNPSYKQAMEPVAERVGLLNDLQKRFNFQHVPGEGLVPTDTTASKVQTSLRDNKAVTQDALGKLKDVMGTDYSDMAKDYQLAQQFKNTGPNGSRRTVLGGALGGALGHMVIPGIGTAGGSALGATVGATMDKYGGQALR
jgi:hypothetical protein